MIEYSVNWHEEDPAFAKKYIEQTRELHSLLTPFVPKSPRQAFLNFRYLDIDTTEQTMGGIVTTMKEEFMGSNISRITFTDR